MTTLTPQQRKRRSALSVEHQRGFDRFFACLVDFEKERQLNASQLQVVAEHLLRLGERNRNPANTGNIEDLFCHTLVDTGDPIRAYAQALADSVKVVPMDPEAHLFPVMTNIDRSKWYYRVGDLAELSEADKMLVSHTMVAYGDSEMWASACKFVRATLPEATDADVDQHVARMAVQSQHLASSSFILARAHGLCLFCQDLWQRAGYSKKESDDAQAFFDICATYEPKWTEAFLDGNIPSTMAWTAWRETYLERRSRLPEELIYQLSSDTLTNFLDGTLESGKWTDASVAFHGVRSPEDLPAAIARIVNQYVAEHVALHDRPAREIADACADTLRPWGIAFEGDRAIVLSTKPPKAAALTQQLQSALQRLAPSS